jgi:hypothetical protein
MSPLRARMIEDMTLAGLAVGTQKIYIQPVRRVAAHYRRSPDQLSEEEVRTYLLDLCQRGVAHSRPGSTVCVSSIATRLAAPGGCSGKKGSPRHGRSGCLKRCRRIRSGTCSAPLTGPTRCCASSAGATRSGWCRCHNRSSTNWATCGGPIAITAGCSPTGTATHRSTNACCRIALPPLPPRQASIVA